MVFSKHYQCACEHSKENVLISYYTGFYEQDILRNTSEVILFNPAPTDCFVIPFYLRFPLINFAKVLVVVVMHKQVYLRPMQDLVILLQ